MRDRLKWFVHVLLAVTAAGCSSDNGDGDGKGGTGPGPGTGGTSSPPGGGTGGSGVPGGGTTAPGAGSTNVPQGGAGAGTPGSGGTTNPSGGTAPNAGTGNVTPGAGTTSMAGTGSGGAPPAGTGTDLKCMDPVYGAVNIPGINVISDFETDSLHQIVQDGRGEKAEPWHAYAVDDVNDATGMLMTPSPVNPKHTSNNFKVDPAVHGPCSTKGALRVSSPGKAGAGSYAGFGIDFKARTATGKKQVYDASKYTGVGFWAKCAKDLQFAFFKTPDGAQDADVDPAPCSYAMGTCNQYGIKNAVITKDWTYYKLYFSELLQDPNGKNFGTGVDKSKLTAFQIHVNPLSPRSGTPSANPFDCHIDDVHFLSEPAPTVPAATVTWSVSGNQILRNAMPYKIRGLVRPSMEWDYAGFGITREDFQRMKKWKANAVRLAVKDTLWKGASTGAAVGDGMAYQRNVKRAVSWILQQGMDAILDLHYVAGTPTAEHAAFWDQVSKDPFFKDGRIIFELYNEPTADFASLRAWMQSTAQTIRANGATNLLLIGGVDYSYDISGYASNPITGQGALAYVTHPYTFKTTPGDDAAFLNPAKTLPVVATEFGDANVEGFRNIPPTQCDGALYSNYLTKFETAGMSWTAWAWIVDEWGCGFPQMIADYSGTPNAIGTPVQQRLMMLNP